MVGHMKATNFLEQRRRIMTTLTPTSIDNKTPKVKRLREDRFVFFLNLDFVL
jgi:hypothetical protein